MNDLALHTARGLADRSMRRELGGGFAAAAGVLSVVVLVMAFATPAFATTHGRYFYYGIEGRTFLSPAGPRYSEGASIRLSAADVETRLKAELTATCAPEHHTVLVDFVFDELVSPFGGDSDDQAGERTPIYALVKVGNTEYPFEFTDHAPLFTESGIAVNAERTAHPAEKAWVEGHAAGMVRNMSSGWPVAVLLTMMGEAPEDGGIPAIEEHRLEFPQTRMSQHTMRLLSVCEDA